MEQTNRGFQIDHRIDILRDLANVFKKNWTHQLLTKESKVIKIPREKVGIL